MKYKDIKVKVKHEEAELVSYVFIECGSEGAGILDANDAISVINGDKTYDYYDKNLENGSLDEAVVFGGFDQSFDSNKLLNIIKMYIGYAPIIIEEIKEKEDWANKWKDGYEIKEYRSFYVVPEWLDTSLNKPKVLINPNHGFGTGQHESTIMCLELLSDLNVAGLDVIDVGCGSGILGIASLKMDANSCEFIDIDKDAVLDTKEMLSLNGLVANVIEGNLSSLNYPEKDIILANLTGELLLKFKKDIVKLTKKGSFVIISGILDCLKNEVINTYKEKFEIMREIHKGEFNAFLLKA